MQRNPLLMTVMANPRRAYRENPFILIDSQTNKVIRSWKGPMTSPRPWEWAKDAARRLGRPVFVVAHPYVPATFRAGVEVSPLFFFGGPFEEVRPDGSMGPAPAGGYKRNPPGFLPSVAGGIAGTLVANAFSNPSRGPNQPDETAARELELYIENDGDLYRRHFIPIVKNLMKKRVKGIYDHEKAAKLFLYLADAGAKKYYKEFSTSDSTFRFDLATRWLVAKRLRDSFETEAELGNYDKTTWGVSNNPSSRAGRRFMSSEISHLVREKGYPQKRAVAAAYSIARQKGYKLNGRRRKVTMSLDKFARWLKAKNNPKLWNDFIKKIKGYQKWTHGSLPKTVTVEVVDSPGMSGLWITYEAGTAPESAYVMPPGSKRKGAWKHPWDTPPKIKHDPEAGIIIHKLRGKSKVTDFYHR